MFVPNDNKQNYPFSNQKYTKFFVQRLRKYVHKTVGTSVIYGLMSPPFLLISNHYISVIKDSLLLDVAMLIFSNI